MCSPGGAVCSLNVAPCFCRKNTHNSFCYIMLPCGLNLNLFIFQSLLYPDSHFRHETCFDFQCQSLHFDQHFLISGDFYIRITHLYNLVRGKAKISALFFPLSLFLIGPWLSQVSRTSGSFLSHLSLPVSLSTPMQGLVFFSPSPFLSSSLTW